MISHLTRTKKAVFNTLVVASQLFLTYYIALFFYSLTLYYTEVIPHLFSIGRDVLGVFFSLIFGITILFYVSGLGVFLWDARNHLKKHLKL